MTDDRMQEATTPRGLRLVDVRVIHAARSWWASKRPATWSLQMHLEHPSVNTTGIDAKLANAVAAHVRMTP